MSKPFSYVFYFRKSGAARECSPTEDHSSPKSLRVFPPLVSVHYHWVKKSHNSIK